jgi:hypothetical protein
MHFDNYDLREAPELVALRAVRKFRSYSTCVCWIQLFNQIVLATIMRRGRWKAQTSSSWLSTAAFFLRPLFLSAGRTYTISIRTQIRKCIVRRNLKRKAASTTADLAFLPQNMTLREYYWTEPPQLGMRGVPIADTIDTDEAGFFLEHSDRKFEHS